MVWEVRVDGRLYEYSRTEERKNEIVKILKEVFPNAQIDVKKKK